MCIVIQMFEKTINFSAKLQFENMFFSFLAGKFKFLFSKTFQKKIPLKDFCTKCCSKMVDGEMEWFVGFTMGTSCLENISIIVRLTQVQLCVELLLLLH